MTQEQITRFIDSNCHNCKLQKPLMPKARCELWHGLDKKSHVTLDNTHLFIDAEGNCRYIQAKGQQ